MYSAGILWGCDFWTDMIGLLLTVIYSYILCWEEQKWDTELCGKHCPIGGNLQSYFPRDPENRKKKWFKAKHCDTSL